MGARLAILSGGRKVRGAGGFAGFGVAGLGRSPTPQPFTKI